jgi:hypothetical protein
MLGEKRQDDEVEAVREEAHVDLAGSRAVFMVGGEDFVVLQAGAHGGPDAIDAVIEGPRIEDALGL